MSTPYHAFHPRRITLANDPTHDCGHGKGMCQEKHLLDRDWWPCDVCGGSKFSPPHFRPTVTWEKGTGGWPRIKAPRRKRPTAAVLSLVEPCLYCGAPIVRAEDHDEGCALG